MTQGQAVLRHLQTRGSIADRLWARVDRSGGPESCWVWHGASHQKGYGTIASGSNGPVVKTHRVAWELANGPIPPGMQVLHSCDNPPCCNPLHLWLGTNADNVADRVSKGREGPHHGEHNGHAKLTRSQVEEIRRRRAAGERRMDLAREFGLDETTVYRIVRHLTWTEVVRDAA